MNQLLEWLSGGDLRSDGLADEVVAFVLEHPELADDLAEGLDAADDVIRGRTADALEKIGRSRPDLVVGFLPKLVDTARSDRVPMVKMHLAMLLGHLALYGEHRHSLTSALLDLLDDESVFAKSWAIVSLCIIARKYPAEREQIVIRIAQLEPGASAAIRSRIRKALILLANENAPFPKGWIKSEHLAVLDQA
jgi:HEAT repeat protein